MEVKINREIREYTEAMFFGLSLRQFIFSALACAAAVIFYFLLKPVLGMETVSWVCILAAVPFAVIGFVRYNGMYAEDFIAAFIRSEILLPKTLTFGDDDIYYGMIKEAAEDRRGRWWERGGKHSGKVKGKSHRGRRYKQKH